MGSFSPTSPSFCGAAVLPRGRGEREAWLGPGWAWTHPTRPPRPLMQLACTHIPTVLHSWGPGLWEVLLGHLPWFPLPKHTELRVAGAHCVLSKTPRSEPFH